MKHWAGDAAIEPSRAPTDRGRRPSARGSFLPAAFAVGLALGLTTGAFHPARAEGPPAGAGTAQSPPPPRNASPLDVTIDLAKVNLDEHRLELKASHDLTKVTIKVVGDSGAVLASEERDLPPLPAGRPLVLTWTPSSDEPPLRIEVFVYDVDGFYKGVAITPWSVTIPHDDVKFKTDSSNIEEAEKPKLEAAFTKVTDALAKHPDLKPTLYLAGHTDTVGDAAHNLRLSKQRAQAIGRWFRQRGLRIPVAFEGFGETALLVVTGDEVDEPRNRRVDYILALEPPAFKGSGMRPAWNRM
jgi:outer membrane protein OmpA-like peptidoglycan-associated protein